MDQLTRIHPSPACRMSMTPPALYLPPPDTLSGNHPELTVHPQMNSRSVLCVSYNVRVSLTFHMSCLVFVLLSLMCIYCFSPLSYCPVVSTSAADAPVIDYFVDDRTSTVELTGKQSPFPSPDIAYLFRTFLALGMVTAAATLQSYSI